MTPDLSFMEARTVLLTEHTGIELLLVGCGGTGSHLARPVAQVAHVLQKDGKRVRVSFIDPDFVEPGNVPRQLFAEAEIGMSKAAALARRYGAAWGIAIDAFSEKFSEKQHNPGDLKVIVGCVDNAAARRSIAAAVRAAHMRDEFGWRHERPPLCFWLDCGNDRQSGQVLLGTTSETAFLERSTDIDGVCLDLPLPTLQAPELLQPRADEEPSAKLSCAELLALNLQALSVNARVAAEAGDMLMRLLVTHDLKRFATYFDLPSGTSRSVYCTREAISAYVPPAPVRKRRRAA